MNKIICYIVICLVWQYQWVCAGTVYDTVYEVLGAQNHRLAGSQNYLTAIEVISDQLKKSNIEVHSQSFTTQVPITEKISLKIDGKQIDGVMSLAPNGIVPVSTEGKVLTGPLYYLGEGRMDQFQGFEMPRGAIAILDFSTHNMDMAFLAGAQAVIFIEDGKATQWDVSHHFRTIPVNIPRVYISKSQISELPPLKLGKIAEKASLEVASKWKDVTSSNLWAWLPAKQSKSGETIILAATLDTFGAIPEFSPQRREAANIALLTELATELSKLQLERNVLVLYTGSRYNAHEGLRYFYEAYNDAVYDSRITHTLEIRGEGYLQEEEEFENRRLLCENPVDFFNQSDKKEYDRLLRDIRKRLRNNVNSMNFELMELSIAGQKVPSENKDELLRLKSKVDEVTYVKGIWNNMQRQISEGKIENNKLGDDEVEKKDSESFSYFKTLLKEIQIENDEGKNRARINHQNILSSVELKKKLTSQRIVLQLNLDYSNISDYRLYVSIGENYGSALTSTSLGSLSRILRTVGEADGEIQNKNSPKLYKDSSLGLIIPSQLTTPFPLALACSIAHGSRVPAFHMMNVGASMNDDQMPESSDVDLSSLLEGLVELVPNLCRAPELSINSALPQLDDLMGLKYIMLNGTLKGMHFQTLQRGSKDPEGPAYGAFALQRDVSTEQRRAIVGHCLTPFARINHFGKVYFPRLLTSSRSSFLGIDFDEVGAISKISKESIYPKNVNLFYCYSGSFFRFDHPERYDLQNHGMNKLIKGSNDNGFNNFNIFHGPDVTVFFKDRSVPSKILMEDLLLTNSDETSWNGMGYSDVGLEMLSLNSSDAALKDLRMINTKRYGALQSKGIVNNSIAILDAESADHLKLGKDAAEQGEHALSLAHSTFSLTLAQKAYLPLRELSNDMVKAVVILMILLLPFAFAMERLLFGFASIYKQIMGFIGVFLFTFFLLYQLHPAFALADAPLIIFLAFVIILLSGMVIYIIMGKFKAEIKALQGLGTKAHSMGKESSTALASVLIGISGMKNRPLKTFLTATTIVLLTFTILVFASFDSQMQVVKTYLGGGNGEERIEIHRSSILNIPKSISQGIENLYGEKYDIFKRYSNFSNPLDKQAYRAPVGKYYVVHSANQKTLALSGMLGFDPKEIKINKDLSVFRALSDYRGDGTPLLLAEHSVHELGAKVGDEVVIGGQSYVLVGEFKSSTVDSLSNIDGTKITPPDYDATMTEAGMETGKAMSEDALNRIDTSSFLYIDALKCGITLSSALEKFDFINHQIMMYPKEFSETENVTENIARIFKGPIYVNAPNGQYQYFYTSSIQGSGLGEIVVPLLLGGLIIFSSLMGSIVDREKEIFTFSALGLAPPDVATLFFAESAVYSVIGGVGGYLFSQVASKFMNILATFGLFQPPEMNFSSLSSIYTILIVMGVVILSTIIPASKAGKSANPGIARKWKMPIPENNKLNFVFPFTVSHHDLGGVLHFVKEHFESHSDASLGSFATQDVVLSVIPSQGEDKSGMQLELNMALAPFDLGIFQKFTMRSRESDIKGILEIAINIEKNSGAESAWLRSNRNFIDDLRQQFLLWRSMPIDTIEHYIAMAQAKTIEA